VWNVEEREAVCCECHSFLFLVVFLFVLLDGCKLSDLFLPSSPFFMFWFLGDCVVNNSKASYTLSVKLREFTVWRHTWRKNWVNCALLTGNNVGARTVLSSSLSHRELRSSLRESHRHSVQFLLQFFCTVKLHSLT
jgi:hypothetical protein